ncbi:MAG: lycopene cyclase family protein [Allosphingosinicella sp.]
MRARNHGLLIAGDGASAALAALAMAKLRPDTPLLLVGETARFGGARPLFLFEDQLNEEERAFVEPLTQARWDGVYAALPGRSRKLRLACRILSPEAIDAALRDALPPDRLRGERRLVAVRDASLLLDGGEALAGDGALDARSWTHQTTLELGWRHSLARTFDFAAPHRVDLPVVMDSTLSEGPACAFFACTPLSPTRLIVEHVHYAESPDPSAHEGETQIGRYLAARGWAGAAATGEVQASLPVALGGDFEAYYRIGGARVAKLGKRGGFFFPTSGAPVPDAVRNALLLARQRDFGGEALHDLFEEAALASWRRREPYRGFDRRLFAGEGCAPLNGLFGLEAPLLGRLFGERLGLFDRRKLAAL